MKVRLLLLICLTGSTLLHGQPPEAYFGGVGQGFATGSDSTTAMIYQGQSGDGFAISEIEDTAVLYTGLAGDGFASFTNDMDNIIYKGTDGDGFGFQQLLYYHIWTGNIDSDWKNTGNWADATIPSLDLRVRIPNNRPYYPVLSGSLHVGDNTGSPDYLCKELRIASNADVTLGASALLRNYSTVEIGGVLRSHNVTGATIINRPGSVMTVRSGGQVRIE